MKKIKKCFIILLCSLFLLAGCKEDVESKDTAFDELEEQLFLSFLGNDPLDVNYTLYNPSNYGIVEMELVIYDYSIESSLSRYQALGEVKSILKTYKNKELNEENKLTKKILIDYIDKQLAYSGFENYETNLGSYLGYQAQLPLILGEYRFDSKDDINYYFTYLENTLEVFQNIIAYEKNKANLGRGISDEILQRCYDQCDEFIESGSSYLISVFNEKIDKATYLTSLEKKQFQNTNELKIQLNFIPAYEYLKEQIASLKGKATTSGNLASFEDGNKYYEIMLQDRLGTIQSVEEVDQYLDEKISYYLRQLSLINLINPSIIEEVINENLMEGKVISDLIPFFQENIEGKFPILKSNPTIEIKEISDSLKDNFSPAAYISSPIDEIRTESIYINPNNISQSDSYTYTTIAHEGYPGHLYQHVYLKESSLSDVRKLLNYMSYSEGWATYVEHYVVSFIHSEETYSKIYESNSALTYLILGKCDIGINYFNWTINELQSYLSYYFSLSNEEVIDMYYDLIEVPTNYLSYYYSFCRIKDIKAAFQKKLGNKYTDLLFHTIYLNTGPCSFEILEEVYDNYKI